MPPAPPLTVTADDHQLAAEIGADVGRLLLDLRTAATHSGVAPDRLRDEGDMKAHQRIMALLGAARPDDSVLSEEGVDDARRLTAERVWVVDPLDGTREFGEAGRTDWAVHIALVVGGVPVVGAVALPAQDLVLSTRPAPPPPPPRPGPLRVILSRSRRPPAASRVAEALGAELVALGSAGAKTMAVVRGHVDAYVHAGGLYQWDSAAPVAVATSAGLHVSRIDGAPLVYNGPDPSLPDLLVCRPQLAQACLAALAQA